MSIVSKLLGAWVVSRAVPSSTPIFMRLLAGMAAVTFFAVFAAVISAMLVAGLVWFAYGQLLASGIAPGMAVLVISLVLLLVLSSLIMMMQRYWFRIYTLARKLMNMQSPLTGGLNSLADAFMDGYNTRSTRRV